MKSVNFWQIACLYVVFLFAQSTFGQSPSRCSVDKKINVSYELIEENPNTLPPYILSLRIVVKEGRYNEEYMTRLAETINERYCKNEEITATIFDNKRAARTTDLWAYNLGKIDVPELRGFFSLLRDKKTGAIYYSTKRGNRTDEKIIRFPWKN